MSGTAAPADQTYGTMQARIADECDSTPALTSTHITNAIQDAIRKHERTRFWFNEMRWDNSPLQDSAGNIITDSGGLPVLSSPLFTTVPGQEYYGAGTSNLIGSAVYIDMLRVLQGNSNRWALNVRTSGWMDDQSVITTALGLPTDYAYVAGTIRLYPIPTQAYPVLAQGTGRFPALVNASDTNPWTTYAERLIRQSAKAICFRDVLYEPDKQQMCEQDALAAKADLDVETTRRVGPVRIRARA